MPLFKVRLPATSFLAGQQAETVLTEQTTPQALAVTLFENKPRGFLLEAYYDAPPALEAIERALAVIGADIGRASLEGVADENWVAVSQAALPPVRAGGFIVHSRHDRARVGLRRFAIEIEAGEAFGTGHNATTAGCLAALGHLARRQRFQRVLDLGCGTGVLAIAAARALPQAHVLASDNDPLATSIARGNVGLNRVNMRVRIVTAAGLSHPALRQAQPFDLVLANILPHPLMALAPAMYQAIKPGGVAVLSGLLNEQAREVVATYRAAGFHLLAARRYGEWTVLNLMRRRQAGKHHRPVGERSRHPLGRGAPCALARQ
jgi:ribosomal protein L11 methyltransferase